MSKSCFDKTFRRNLPGRLPVEAEKRVRRSSESHNVSNVGNDDDNEAENDEKTEAPGYPHRREVDR